MKEGYVVIYDTPIVGDESVDVLEEYYGFFSSIEQARSQFLQMRGDDPRYRNAKICLVVEQIDDVADDAPLDSAEATD